MSVDEQEALSRRHDSSAIVILLRLTSGRFAVYNNARELCGIINPIDWQNIEAVWTPPAEAPSQPTINLKELGLE